MMRPLWYKRDRPESGVLLALTFGAVCAAWAFQYARSEPPECPAFTPDGRPLQGIDARWGRHECRYSPLPRPAVTLSPLEHRRMARQKELMK